jgi:DNA invertase Pin-like site-specific DNA recombinase
VPRSSHLAVSWPGLPTASRAGLKAAKARGVQLGRKPVMTAAQAKHARKLIDGGENPRTVARTLGVDRATMYRHLARLSG